MTEHEHSEEGRRARVAALSTHESSIPHVVEALGDADWRVRKEAVQRMATWPDPARAAAVLVETLSEPDNVGRRNAAVEALSRLGAVAVSPLLVALQDRPEHRKLIVDTLGLLGDPRGAAALVASLADSDENVRAAAAEALGQVGGAEARAGLSQALARGELLLSVACLEALNRMEAPVALSLLAPLLGSPLLRPAVTAALGHCGDAGAASLLVPLLVDRSRTVREAAVLSLARLDDPERPGSDAAGDEIRGAFGRLGEEGERFLVQALMEGRAATRRAAARLMGLSGRSQVVRPLTLALGDPETQEAAVQALSLVGPGAVGELAQAALSLDPQSRAAVLGLLGTFGGADPRVQFTLLGALGEPEIEVAAAAAGALGAVGGAESVPPLLQCLTPRALDDSTDLCRAAEDALCRIARRHPEEARRAVRARGYNGPEAASLCRVIGACGTEADAPSLTALLNADESRLRAAAVEALACLPVAPGAVETSLRYALADEAPEVRVAAVRALGRVASAVALDALAEPCDDRDPQVRAEAVRAVGGLLRAQGPLAATARSRLAQLASRSDGAVAAHALEALASAGPERAGDSSFRAVFLGAMRHPDAEVVKAALRALAGLAALGDIDDTRVAALAAIEDPRWDVRRSAAATLASLSGTRDALAARLVVEEDPLVRGVLTAALAKPSP